MLQYSKTNILFGQRPKVVAKCSLNCMRSIVVMLNIQNWKIDLRSSILIIKSDAQRQMVESGFGRRCHDLSYFGIVFFSIFFECIIYLRASSQTLWKPSF